MLTIDYWIKFGTESARYAILANDDAIKSITVTQHSNGQLQVAKSMNMEWQPAGKVVIGKWHHFRYVVNCVRGDFSVYVDDMETPRVAGISYRDTRTVSLTRLWILGSESTESTTYLGNIRSRLRRCRNSRRCPLGEWPYYVRGVAGLHSPPTSAREFVGIAPIELTTGTGPATWSDPPPRFCATPDYLYVYFQCTPRNMARGLNEVVERDGRPWLNDCFEIFLQPDILLSRPIFT